MTGNKEDVPEWRKQLMMDVGCWKTNQIFYVFIDVEKEATV